MTRMTRAQGTNRAIREENRNRIFRYICQNGRTSNPAIANALKMSLPTVLQNTKELLESGILYDAGELDSTGGRKAKTVDVAADYRCSIGLDITRNHIVLVLTNLMGANLDRERIFIQFADEDDYYQQIKEKLGKFIARNHLDKERILGVGVSIPGIVNNQKNQIDRSHVLGLKDFPLDKIARYIPYRTWFINDANAGAFAEGFHAPEGDHFFYLSLNNTVGGSFYDKKRVLNGDNYRCGEVGHVILVPEGHRCYCGVAGCADTYCSALRLSEMEDGNLELFFENLDKEMEAEKQRWKEYVYYIALLIHNIRVTLDYDIILGGYVGSAMGDHIADIRKEVGRIDMFGEGDSYIRPCVFKISESAFGAALYEMDNYIRQI